jgi:glycosyltransferase involved in cell wall biosynthesis
MTILFGHPGGNPNSFHAALAHREAGLLEAFCIPWLPSAATVGALRAVPGLRPMAERFARRRFAPLDGAPLVQGRLGEARRLLARASGAGDERLSYQANDWLMRTMARECARPAVTVVHAYEDCSQWQFEEAKRRGKACVYDMPIGYFRAWEETRELLLRRYADWVPEGGLPESRWVRPEQKRREMQLADLVLAPSDFVAGTILRFEPGKRVAIAPYGVDLDFWRPGPAPTSSSTLRFIHAGQLSLRKGVPLLLEAWERARLPDATLSLVGGWRLAERKRGALPAGVAALPPCSRAQLRERFAAADVLVLASFFEGQALSLLEAMACGLPVLATHATGGTSIVTPSCGRTIDTGDIEALVAALRWFSERRGELPALRRAARARAEECTWESYRHRVTQAVAGFA